MSSIVEYIYQTLQDQLDAQQAQLSRLTVITERAETAGGVASSTLEAAPNAAVGGVGGGDLLWISNGRKISEGVGAGTGVLAYYNPSTDSWRRVSDDAAVSI